MPPVNKSVVGGYYRLPNVTPNRHITVGDIASFNIINMKKEPEVWVKNTSLQLVTKEEEGLLFEVYKTLPKGAYYGADLVCSIVYMKNNL